MNRAFIMRVCVFLGSCVLGHAQAPALGPGFVLETAGALTADPAQVIGGTGSIVGSYSGAASFTPYLRTNPSVIPLTPNHAYQVTFRYKIITAPNLGFEVLFFSPTGGSVGNFLPSFRIMGSAGATGTATLTNTLGPYTDYQARWNVVGTGAIVIDDITIVDVASSAVIASENAEMPPITNFSPPGSLLAPGSNSVSISFNTIQPTNCGYSLATPLDYSSMQPFDSGPATTTHVRTVSGLSSDTTVLNRVYIRCASNPAYLQATTYRTVAVPGQAFPRIGNIWWGTFVYTSNLDQAKKYQLFLGATFTADQAKTLRAANPSVLILPSVNIFDSSGEGAPPDDYYLKDVHGSRIESWCASPPRFILNVTKPEVARFVGQYAYSLLAQSDFAFDGLFFDTFSPVISYTKADCNGNPVQIDTNGDGISDDPATADAAWRAGEYLIVSTFRSLAPNAYVSGHVIETPPTGPSLSAFNGTSIVFYPVDVREGRMPFGTLWSMYQSWETQGVPPVMTMLQSSPPNQIAYGYGYDPVQVLPPATVEFARTYYPNMRFGLALALMNNGFFVSDFGDQNGIVNWWYDEYDFKLGFPLGPSVQIGSGQTGNLLSDGSFENGLGSWKLSVINDGQASATAALDTAIAADGNSSAHITVLSTGTVNWHIDFEQANLPLTAGTTYQVQFWARADSPRVITVFSQGGAPNFTNYGLSAQIAISTDWKLYSASFIAPVTANDGRLEFWVGDVAGNVWMDGVQLSVAANEIYRRDYTNGIVLLNGTASRKTISIESGFARFSGSQSPRWQYIVDDAAPDFTSDASWKTVKYDTGDFHNGQFTAPFYHAWNSTTHQQDSPGASAQWNLNIPEDGQYTIQVWLPAAPNAGTWTKSAVYEIVSAGNVVASVTLDQTSAGAGDQWHTIATLNLSAAGLPFLRVRNGGSGSLIADAVYVYSAALYNDGSPVSQVILGPMDGILLQRAVASCTYALSSGGQAFGALGSTGAVNITTGASCPWTVSNLPTWVLLTSAASGLGSGTVTFQVVPNSGGDLSGSFTIAEQTFAVEQQAASIPGLNFIGSMPHIAAQENWTTAFTLVNKGAASAQARLSLFGDPSGLLALPLTFPQQLPTAGPLLAASFDRTLAANASLIVDSAGPQTPPVLVGSAQLAATGAIDGFAVFSFLPTKQEAVVPLETRNASSYLLAFDNTNSVVLGVALENVSTQAANVSVAIRDDTGTLMGTGSSLSVPGSGHTSFVLSDQFPATKNKRGTIQFGTPSGGQISALGVRFTPPGTLTTIPVLANVGTTGGSISHIASANGWKTTFVLVNAGSGAAQAHLKFFADNGSPLSLPLTFPQSGGGTSSVATLLDRTLAAGATLIVESTGPDTDPLLTGSAQLTTDGSISGFVIFRYNPNGQEAVVPLENRAANAYLLAFDNTAGIVTGVAVSNASGLAATVPVVIRDDTGTLIGNGSIPLAANGHTAFGLATQFPVTANIRGTLEFKTPSGGNISALGVRTPSTLTFTTLPALAK